MPFSLFEKVKGHPELDLSIEIANSVLRNADYSNVLIKFAHENGISDKEISQIKPRVQVSYNTQSIGEPFSITINKDTISLNQKYTNRILFANEEKFDEFEEEVAILSLFFALCIIHELAHVIVRFKAPDNEQKIRLTPVKYSTSCDEIPEAGGFMEEHLFFGESCLLLTKQTWKSKSRKVMGLLLLHGNNNFYRVSLDDIHEIIDEKTIQDMRDKSILYDPSKHKELVIRKASSIQHEHRRRFKSKGLTREEICGTEFVIMDRKCGFSFLPRKRKRKNI
jgi:hypothetical protein